MNRIGSPQPMDYFLMKCLRLILAALLGGCSLAGDVQAKSIGINFVGGPHGGGVNGRDGSLVTGVAGVVPQSGWNNVAPWSEDRSAPGLPPDDPDVDGSAFDLLDDAGGVTTADISWFSDNTYYADNDANLTNEDTRLMDGYIDIGGNAERRKLQVTLTEVPYERYDLYVYVGSDGDNRLAGVSLNSGPQTFFLANTGRGSFLGPADYKQATAITQEAAVPSNYLYYPSLDVTTAAIELEGIAGNAGIHAIQVVDRSDLFLLEIDSLTGEAWIVGKGLDESLMSAYQIASSEGSLLPDQLRSLSSQRLDEVDGPADADAIAGNSEGERWEVFEASATAITEARLFGASAIDETVILSLGKIYDTAFGVDPSLSFSYALATGPPLNGIVRFIESPLPGDYDRDGNVDPDDYEVWRASYGASGPDLLADGARSGRVDAADYTVWRDAYAAASLAISTPEPSSVVTCMITLTVGASMRRRDRQAPMRFQ